MFTIEETVQRKGANLILVEKKSNKEKLSQIFFVEFFIERNYGRGGATP